MIVLTLSLLVLLTPSGWAQSYMFNRADYSTGPGAVSLALGDLNNDGRMDVVVGNAQGSDSISVLLAKPDGTFGPAVNYAVLGSASSLAVGDFDNDGKLGVTVISGSQGAEGISILLGNGDGTLQQSTFVAAGQSPTGLAVGDFNADGRLDLAISDNGVDVNGVDILLGNADVVVTSVMHVHVSGGCSRAFLLLWVT